MKRSVALILGMAMLCGCLFAEQVWPQPLDLFSARNIEFSGHGLSTSTGNHLITWKDWEQMTPLQQFRLTDPSGNAVWQRAMSPEISFEQRWILESGGDYILFFSRGNGFLHGYRLNAQGEHLWGESGLQLTHVNMIRPQSTGKMIADGNGGHIFLWAWAFDGIDTPTNYYLQHMNAQGETEIVSGSGSSEFKLVSDSGLAGPPDLFLLSDGGIICAYRLDNSVIIRRMLPNHNFAWTQTINAGSAVWPTLTDTGDGCFNLVWHTSEAVLAMRYDLDFTAQWSQPLNLCGSTQGLGSASRKTVQCSDGKTLSVWLSNGQLRMQCFSNDGTLECGTYGALVLDGLSPEANFDLLPDDTGGCYVQVSDPDGGTILGQYITAQNLVLPQAAVLAQSTADATLGAKAFCALFPSGMSSYHHLSSPGTREIRMQGMNSAGGLLYSQGGQSIVSATSGKAVQSCSAAAGGKVFCTWLSLPAEAPNANTPGQISYQLADPLGSLLLSQPGRLFADDALQTVPNLKIAATDEGQALLCWIEAGNPTRLKAQLIDTTGNQLWEAGGRTIAESQDSSDLTEFYLTPAHGAAYIVWTEYSNGSNAYIRAQKVSGGQTVWEAGGRILISGSWGRMSVLGLDEDYLVYGRVQTGIAYPTDAWVYRFNPEGGAQPGFMGTSFENHLGGQGSGYSAVTVSGCKAGTDRLYVFYNQAEWQIEWYNYYPYGQAISSTGEKLWGYDGIAGLSGSLLHTVGNDLFCIRGYPNRSVYKYNSEGVMQWNVAVPTDSLGGYTVVQQLAGSWDNRLVGIYGPLYSRLFYFCFDSSGWITLPSDAVLETSSLVLFQSLCRWNDDLYVIWGTRISNYDYNLAHIRMQRINSYLVDAGDLVVPAVARLRLQPGYPNPFSERVAFSAVMPERAFAWIGVYNLRGQLVRRIFKGTLEKGSTSFEWDGRDDCGTDCGNGIYVLRARSGGRIATIRVVKLR